MMIKRLKLTKRRKLLGAVIICVALITGSTMLWQMGQVAEAAVLDPHPGLVGWWRFDEGTGTAAEDSSGFGNDGTISSATWVDGKYGKALSFDGTNDYVSVDHHSSLNFGVDPFTVSLWAKQVGTSSYYPSYSKGTGIHGFTIHGVSGRIQGGDGTNYFDVSGMFGEDLRGKDWQFLTITYDGSKFQGYLNGVAKKAYSWPYGTGNPTQDLLIGDFWGPNFDGEIDEVRVYNRALSAPEIQEIFESGPDFSSRILAKVPKGATQFIATLSWQGVGNINVTIESPPKNYTEDELPVYQRTSYSSSSGDMLNIKRLEVSVTALSSDEDWYIALEIDGAEDYRITVEIQR